MSSPITFLAHIHRVSVDAEGQASITLKVPQTHLDNVMPLFQKSQTNLHVTVVEEGGVV